MHNNNIYFIEDQFPKCSFKGCDLFLEPTNRFNCYHCKKIYCSEHIFIYKHECISIKKNDIEKINNISPIHPKCSLNECKIRMDLCNRFTCKKCGKVFCATHRIDFNHGC